MPKQLLARCPGRHSTRLLSLTSIALLAMLAAACSPSDKPPSTTADEPLAAPPAGSPDDGSQMHNPFRINYAGYLPLQEKMAVYLSETGGNLNWQLKNSTHETLASGTSGEYRENDHASGDSFFLIDFSAYATPGEGYYLQVGDTRSHAFAIANDPYGDLKLDVYNYFKQHRREGDVFSRSVHDWTDHQLSFNFIADAGDQGYYPVNAAEAKWSLINLLESYP